MCFSFLLTVHGQTEYNACALLWNPTRWSIKNAILWRKDGNNDANRLDKRSLLCADEYRLGLIRFGLGERLLDRKLSLSQAVRSYCGKLV